MIDKKFPNSPNVILNDYAGKIWEFWSTSTGCTYIQNGSNALADRGIKSSRLEVTMLEGGVTERGDSDRILTRGHFST